MTLACVCGARLSDFPTAPGSPLPAKLRRERSHHLQTPLPCVCARLAFYYYYAAMYYAKCTSSGVLSAPLPSLAQGDPYNESHMSGMRAVGGIRVCGLFEKVGATCACASAYPNRSSCVCYCHTCTVTQHYGMLLRWSSSLSTTWMHISIHTIALNVHHVTLSIYPIALNVHHVWPLASTSLPLPSTHLGWCVCVYPHARSYAHMYHSHFQRICTLGEEAHLNTCFKHFLYFCQ
eukprot:1177455-Prorocentrum_minimum.AAC.1